MIFFKDMTYQTEQVKYMLMPQKFSFYFFRDSPKS